MENMLDVIQVSVLALTAIIALGTGLFIGFQTHRHFLLERSTHFIERFNSKDMVDSRYYVDCFLSSEPDWSSLLKGYEENTLDDEVRKEISNIILFTNFFQELATADRHKTIHSVYIWDLFGGLVNTYWDKLQPFIHEYRKVKERDTLYQDFEKFVATIKKMN